MLWKGTVYYDKDKKCHGSSKKGRPCSVLGTRERFVVQMNLGEL